MPAVHLLAALSQTLSQTLQLPLRQQALSATINAATAAITFLRGLPLDERLVTTDAALTHHAVCQTILDGGSDYLCYVKENQPTLLEDIQRAFTPLYLPRSRSPRRTHGRLKWGMGGSWSANCGALRR